MAFTRTFTAQPADIDELGHVNNAVWVQWIQEIALAHWYAIAPAEHQTRYVWVILRHEIDYRGNLGEGESATGETWVGVPGRVRFDRFVRFARDGKTLVEAKTTWAPIERATGKLVRITPELAAPFLN
ncbi:MAG: thioesterase family protein [Pseudomonadota bacterium]